MKKTYDTLKTAVVCFIGAFIGKSLYQFYDFKTHPEAYAAQSAPWYLEIEILGAIIAVIVAILLIVMLILKKKMKSR